MTEQEWLNTSDHKSMLDFLCPVSSEGFPSPEVLAAARATSDRKLRLFAVAVCCSSEYPFGDRDSRKVVELIEMYADGTMEDLKLAVALAREVRHRKFGNFVPTITHNGIPNLIAILPSISDLLATCQQNIRHCLFVITTPPCVDHDIQVRLLRDIVGNPWRKWLVADRCVNPEALGYTDVFDESWLTTTVLGLASAAYNVREADNTLCADRLFILADALEDAGCEIKPADCPVCLAKGGHWHQDGAGSSARKWTDCPLCNGRRYVSVPHPILTHLRSPGPHYRGMWSLDIILGKE